MSDLYHVTVINKGEKWVDLSVRYDHIDAGNFSEEIIFAHRLLTSYDQELYDYDMGNNQYVPKAPLAEALPYDKICTNFELDLSKQYIEKVVAYEIRNMENSTDRLEEKIKDKCYAEGITEESENWDDVFDEHYEEIYDDTDLRPVAKYRIWVSDPKWIKHLIVGDECGSAAYGDDGPWIEENWIIELEPETPLVEENSSVQPTKAESSVKSGKWPAYRKKIFDGLKKIITDDLKKIIIDSLKK